MSLKQLRFSLRWHYVVLHFKQIIRRRSRRDINITTLYVLHYNWYILIFTSFLIIETKKWAVSARHVLFVNITKSLFIFFTVIFTLFKTVSEHFTDILRTKQNSWRLIRQNGNSFQEIRKYFKISLAWYRFIFDRNDYRADRFQIVRDCSIVFIVNNQKIIRLSGTGALSSNKFTNRKTYS